jgi:hypothetical protein
MSNRETAGALVILNHDFAPFIGRFGKEGNPGKGLSGSAASLVWRDA